MNLTRHAATLTAGLVLASVSPTALAQVRVAVVDMQRALNETADGRNAKTKLKRLFKKRQQTLDKKQTDLKKMKDEIEKQRDVLSRKALQKKLEDYQKAFVELQTTYVEYQRELTQKEAQLTKGILERMQGILRGIGRKQGYTLIVERNEGGVVWAPSRLDVTDRLIEQYNAGKGGGSSNESSSKRR